MTMPEGLGRALPEIVGRDMFDALVIRTDFSDDESWNAVVGELRRPWGPSGEFPAGVQVVDAPAWSGATVDEVLAAVHAVHVNLTLGNMGFAEFAAAASTEPDQVLRPV
ncbi:DUF6924 domain-containing protein [Streptomyces sp. NPDC058718]|uniref:DUF6924 domain-containing protein n=1 Tax=Streptomyces sp. NPDC058718 TaxID=3346610 RepID=UPI003683C5A5